ncbi:hypothetical protein, partial [Sodalis sp.]|uniref:hypothetical protein n=1 Tax=Sodalis sp. (in: enterobacteria) TaxID=1898979 RepID=UPI003872B1DF
APVILVRYLIAPRQPGITISLMYGDAGMQLDKAVTVMLQAKVGERACAVVDGRPVAGDDMAAQGRDIAFCWPDFGRSEGRER